MNNGGFKKYKCNCCGFYTLDEKPSNTFQICPVCFWEDDGVQFDDPSYEGGANEVSLDLAKKNFIKFGAVEERFKDNVRQPLSEEEHGLE